MLNNAQSLLDLRVPPGSRLEALKRNRAGQYGIRVNDPWRICFEWREKDAFESGDRGLSLRSPGMKQRLPNVHPGEIPLEEFLLPLGVS